MRFQIYIISVLASLIVWGIAYDGTRDIYRGAWIAGVIPNLKIHQRMHRLIIKPVKQFERLGARGSTVIS